MELLGKSSPLSESKNGPVDGGNKALFFEVNREEFSLLLVGMLFSAFSSNDFLDNK